MKIIKDFDTEKERADIIKDMVSKGAVLKEVQYHFDGKHLLFEVKDTFDELAEVKGKLTTLEAKIKAIETNMVTGIKP